MTKLYCQIGTKGKLVVWTLLHLVFLKLSANTQIRISMLEKILWLSLDLSDQMFIVMTGFLLDGKLVTTATIMRAVVEIEKITLMKKNCQPLCAMVLNILPHLDLSRGIRNMSVQLQGTLHKQQFECKIFVHLLHFQKQQTGRHSHDHVLASTRLNM